MPIPDRLFNRTVTLSRRTNTLDAIGAPSVSWSTLEASVLCHIQPVEVKDRNNEQQGREFHLDAKAYIKGTTAVPKEEDRITDTTDGKIYEVVGIRPWIQPGNSTPHHFELELVIPRTAHS